MRESIMSNEDGCLTAIIMFAGIVIITILIVANHTTSQELGTRKFTNKDLIKAGVAKYNEKTGEVELLKKE